jgi:ribonucleoside-diphosphate reductase alpha chain
MESAACTLSDDRQTVEPERSGSAQGHARPRPASPGATLQAPCQVIRRNGSVTQFDATKISVAMTKAFLAVEGGTAAASRRIHAQVDELTAQVVAAVARRLGAGRACHIEDVQDQVELALMRAGEHKVARAYILYREARAAERTADVVQRPSEPPPHVLSASGERIPLDVERLERVLAEACDGLSDVRGEPILGETLRSLYDGVPQAEVATALVMSARPLIEREPNYSFVTARLLLDVLRRESLSFLAGAAREATQAEMAREYPEYFAAFIERGVQLELLDPRLAELDLAILGRALLPERDLQFTYLGLQTLYDRYLLHWRGARFELPQALFMRVAMGLALNEIDREGRAIEFYRLLSSFDFMSSTPTLFNSGTVRSQLSSCYLTTVPDDLAGIYGAVRDNALLSKFAGGLGNDWTRVRALGAHIKGTNGKSQGVVPFLKVANDTAVAVNQGGKRKGAVCAYLETWHLDIEEFVELRKNTGDERRRTHDMHSAHWVPDLFMQRVAADGEWTLFSPDDVPDLHDLYGRAFARAYEEHEARADRGEITNYKRVGAVALWRKMLSMLFETGHPWITFKDPCNLRSPQPHTGVVHSSNLCTEITLNTSDEEIAVCNLGSVNLARHVNDEGLDREHLRSTVDTAMRMLDNVIDLNYYGVPQARRSNLRHRPVGLGLMGFQDALYRLRIPYASEAAIEFADRSTEALSFLAIRASTALAEERGRYPSFDGSLWSRGVLPIDSLELLASDRGSLELDRSLTLDWDALRERVKAVGMRNSNCLAIAPTATISNIVGCAPSIEPAFRNLYVKSNLSGEFTVINPSLVHDLKARGLWDEVMVSDLKYFDGMLERIDRIPAELKALYSTAFEIDARCLVEAGARRQKWLDQSQSLNLYVAEPSGPALDALYTLAWRRGLKTTYYLRTLGATHVERSTVTDGALNAVGAGSAPACDAAAPSCEACQ